MLSDHPAVAGAAVRRHRQIHRAEALPVSIHLLQRQANTTTNLQAGLRNNLAHNSSIALLRCGLGGAGPAEVERLRLLRLWWQRHLAQVSTIQSIPVSRDLQGERGHGGSVHPVEGGLASEGGHLPPEQGSREQHRKRKSQIVKKSMHEDLEAGRSAAGAAAAGTVPTEQDDRAPPPRAAHSLPHHLRTSPLVWSSNLHVITSMFSYSLDTLAW